MAEILKNLLDRRISGVLVVDGGRVIGSVGEGELLHRRYERDDDRQAARILAENIPGVRGVRGVRDSRAGFGDGESML